MIDILPPLAGAAALGCAGLAYLWRSTAAELRKVKHDLHVQQKFNDPLIETLSNRINSLKDLNESLQRELGRLKAEQRAAKPKRGPDGKFVPKHPH